MGISISKSTSTEYQFVLGKIPSDPSIHATDILKLNIYSISLPTVSLNPNEFYWQGKHIEAHAGGITFDPITINFLVDNNFDNWKVLFNWLTFVADNKERPSREFDEYVTDGSIIIFDNFSKINTTVTFKNMWISSLGEVTFSIRDGESLVECSATFYYDRYSID